MIVRWLKALQISRLFEMIYILIDKKKVTAKELADHFEVSVRTIFRDIEALCEAGIPIYTTKGKGGGIGLMDNFILNKSILSSDEQKEIIAALQGLKNTQTTDNGALTKLSAFFGGETREWIFIDFAGWSPYAKDKFETIKKAILKRKVLSFAYHNSNMEKTIRKVEPIQLAFIGTTWYLKAYCLMRGQIRLFKLTRMKEVNILEESYEDRIEFTEQNEIVKDIVSDVTTIKLEIDEQMAYRVFDEFEEEQIERKEDGNFIITIGYPEDNWLYGYLLSYGPYLKILEPESIRQKIQQQLKSTLKNYL